MYTPPPLLLGHPLRFDEPPHRARAVERRFWEDLDFTEANLVIVPGFGGAAKVLAHPTFRPGTRILAVDFHMLDGVEALAEPGIAEGRRIAQGGWWPTPDLYVHSCFPRYASLYRARGVPLRQVHWRPYPVSSGHFTMGPPAHEADHIFAGGRHFRDYGTLVTAAERLELPLPIEVHADPGQNLRAVGPLRLRGTTPLPDYFDAMRTSRFVVLPILHDATRAAGITAISLAFSAGRPVIATRTGATQDHLRHETDALLVPPHDPDALARAIRRLAHDDDLVKHLARGVQRARGQFHVSSWADEIVDGASTQTAVPHEGGTWRTW
jgi:hypothetical protein